jgi:HD-like signal output (HDOD) protein
MTMSTQITTRTPELERALENLQGSGAAALKVMQLVDNPNTTGLKLATAIDVDPIFTTQLLRLANSASFGMTQRIATTEHAVSVVGYSSVRSIAALLAAGLNTQKHPPPKGFWEHSAASAAGCVAVSSRFGIQKGEAFSMGLLHDLGWAILNNVDPSVYSELAEVPVDTARQSELEVDHFGMSHAEAAARVLASWNFPVLLVDAIANHHDRSIGATAHSRVILAGDALAHLVLTQAGFASDTLMFEEMGFSEPALTDMADLTSEYSSEILALLPR